MVVGTPRTAKKLARLVAIVVFPDPPLELMTSVVFMAFVPVPVTRREDYAKVIGPFINYFTGDAKSRACKGWGHVTLTPYRGLTTVRSHTPVRATCEPGGLAQNTRLTEVPWAPDSAKLGSFPTPPGRCHAAGRGCACPGTSRTRSRSCSPPCSSWS